MIGGLPFREIVCLDFEFISEPGENPIPVCLVAKEMVSGRLIKLWQDQLGPEPPFATDNGVLFVAYAAQAELECFIQLGWPLPTRVLDLSAEFRIISNGLPLVAGKGLLGAMSWYSIPGISKEEKKSNRDLILRGGPWNSSEKQEILDYCQSDVDALPPLLAAMLPTIMATPKGLGQALFRGRYTSAVARMQHNGIPIDMETLQALRGGWGYIKAQLINDVDGAIRRV